MGTPFDVNHSPEPSRPEIAAVVFRARELPKSEHPLYAELVQI